MKVDSLALFFSVLALFLAMHGSGRWQRVLLVASITALAGFTRQTSCFFSLGVIGSWYLLKAGKKISLLFMVLSLILISMLYVFLYLLTNTASHFHLVIANINQFYWVQLTSQLRFYFFHGFSVFFVALLGIPVASRLYPKMRPWLLFSCIAALPSALASIKMGSAVNYFFELHTVLALVGGLLFVKMRWQLFRVLFLVLLSLPASVVTPHSSAKNARESTINRANAKKLIRMVKSSAGPILSDDMMGIEPYLGRPLSYQPFEMLQLKSAGIWQEEGILKLIYKRKFKMIILNLPPRRMPLFIVDRWSARQIALMARCYEFGGRLCGQFLFFPRGEGCIPPSSIKFPPLRRLYRTKVRFERQSDTFSFHDFLRHRAGTPYFNRLHKNEKKLKTTYNRATVTIFSKAY